MPIKDLRSNLKLTKVLNAILDSGPTVNTIVYDSGEDESVMFLLEVSVADGGTTISINSIEEDDDAGFSSPTTVAADKIIGSLFKTAITIANHQTKVSSIGVFSTKRYLRAVISNVVGGTGSSFSVIVESNPNELPAIEPED